MTLYIKNTPQVKFDNFDAALSYTATKNTEYIPIKDIDNLEMDHGSHINGYEFTQDGIEALGRAIEAPSLPKVLNIHTTTEDSASWFFNDIMSEKDNYSLLKSKKLVVQDNTIIGVVGSKYTPYDNYNFLGDIYKTVPSDYKFIDGNIVGSKIRINFGSENSSFDVKGRADDKIIPGIQFRSSMVGDTVIGALVRLHRLICLNGMTITDNKSDARAYHVGNDLEYKLNQLMEITSLQLIMIHERIDRLIGIPFKNTPLTLISNNAPFKILPDHKKLGMWFHPKKSYKNDLDRVNALHKSIEMIKNIPLRDTCPISKKMFQSSYKEPMMFDFVESFTESAQRYSIEEQNLMEEEAGVLSNHIFQNTSQYLHV